MVTIYKINKADANWKHDWICAHLLNKSLDSCSKEEAAKILGGEPQRSVVNVYKVYTPFCGYDLTCRAVFWCVGEKGVLANDVLPSERAEVFMGELIQSKGDGSCLVGGHPVLARELALHAPTWQEQLFDAFGKGEWLARFYGKGEEVYATSVWGCKRIEILPK